MANIVTKKGLKIGGEYVIPCEYSDLKPAVVDGKVSDNLYITLEDDLYGIIRVDFDDKLGYTTNMIENSYNHIGEFNNGVAIVGCYDERFGKKYGLVNSNLDVLLDCVFDEIKLFSENKNNLFAICNRGKYGAYDANIKEFILPITFTSVSLVRSNYDSLGTKGRFIIDL